jgi:hypothetical protein
MNLEEAEGGAGSELNDDNIKSSAQSGIGAAAAATPTADPALVELDPAP